jgi:hypothetical protein
MHREHDPILGACTIKLSEVLQTASQNTSVYALDGGMGYGRITISVLFRSVDLKLPKTLLGWDLGSFEVIGDKVIVENDRTGSLSGTRIAIHTDVGKQSISRKWIEQDERRTSWNLARVREGDNHLQKNRILIPVRHRYQSPVRLEFFSKSGRKPVAYAIYWLCDLVDNTETALSLPVYKTPMPKQMTQNYISNIERDKIGSDKIGIIKLTVRFKMGMDDSHYRWVKTNDEHETYESWQCSVAEGYRTRIVKRETSDTVKDLAKDGKVDGPNTRLNTDDSDEGGDVDIVRVPREAPGFEKEIDDYKETTSNEQLSGAFGQELSQYTSDPSSIYSDDSSSLGMQEDLTDSEIENEELKKRRQKQDKKASKAELHRKHRGPMNIKALRHMKFSKDEAKVFGYKLKDKFSMKGREPGGRIPLQLNLLVLIDIVETEL